jgi:hypothetical protein
MFATGDAAAGDAAAGDAAEPQRGGKENAEEEKPSAASGEC